MNLKGTTSCTLHVKVTWVMAAFPLTRSFPARLRRFTESQGCRAGPWVRVTYLPLLIATFRHVSGLALQAIWKWSLLTALMQVPGACTASYPRDSQRVDCLLTWTSARKATVSHRRFHSLFKLLGRQRGFSNLCLYQSSWERKHAQSNQIKHTEFYFS